VDQGTEVPDNDMDVLINDIVGSERKEISLKLKSCEIKEIENDLFYLLLNLSNKIRN